MPHNVMSAPVDRRNVKQESQPGLSPSRYQAAQASALVGDGDGTSVPGVTGAETTVAAAAAVTAMAAAAPISETGLRQRRGKSKLKKVTMRTTVHHQAQPAPAADEATVETASAGFTWLMLEMCASARIKDGDGDDDVLSCAARIGSYLGILAWIIRFAAVILALFKTLTPVQTACAWTALVLLVVQVGCLVAVYIVSIKYNIPHAEIKRIWWYDLVNYAMTLAGQVVTILFLLFKSVNRFTW